MPTTQGPVATQLKFNNAKLSQSSSSSTQFAQKIVRGVSENMRWIVAMNEAGIVNNNSEFLSFFLTLPPISVLHILKYLACGLYFHAISL